MRTVKFLFVLLIGSLSGACSATVNGRHVYLGPTVPEVIVTDNTTAAGELYRNGNFIINVAPQGTVRIPLGFFVDNYVIQFKAFDFDCDGKKRYLGTSTQIFYHNVGTYDHQEWTVSYIQQPTVLQAPPRVVSGCPVK